MCTMMLSSGAVEQSKLCLCALNSTLTTLTQGFDRMATFTLDEPIVCASTVPQDVYHIVEVRLSVCLRSDHVAANDDFECSVIVNISNSHPHLVAVQPCFVRWDRTQWHQPRQVRVSLLLSPHHVRSVRVSSHHSHVSSFADYRSSKLPKRCR